MRSRCLWARARTGVWGIAVALIGLACDGAVDSDSPPISRIEVDPAQASVAAGRTVTLTARVFGGGGEDLGPTPVFWSSQNVQVATVNQAGVVTGVGPGAAQIAASLNGRSGIATITVTARPVVVVRVSPPESDVSTGKTLQLSVEALDGDGATVAGRVATWSSSNTAVATVSGAGLVSGVTAGTATVRATIDGVQGSSLVHVVPIAVTQLRVTPNTVSIPQGAFEQLTATPMDAQGNALSGRLVVWSSNNQSVAVVSSTGHVQSVSPGSATITATCEGVNATATVTVTLVPVASVTIVPDNPSVVVGQTAPLSATVRDAQGNILNGRTVTWSSSAPAVVTVSGSGVLTGVSLGTATITATSGGVDGTATATVSAVPVVSVTVSPPSGAVTVGGTLPLAAIARDGQGNVLTGRTTFWSSSNPSIAAVNASGVVTGVSAGAATITASVGGVNGTATISVSAVPVTSITVTPNPATVEEKKTLQLSATLRDAQGNVITGRTVVWTSSNNAVATVSQSGLVTGVAPATAAITATVSGSSAAASVPVTVTYVPVAGVTVSPATASVLLGATTPFSATLLDAGGQPLTAAGRTITWSSSDASKASVNPSTGVATGVAAGTASIVASAASPGQSTAATGSATLTVTLVPVASVTVSPPSATIGIAATQQLTATAFDSANNPITGAALGGRTTAWSSDSSAASVSANGLVTGVAAGSAKITATIGGVGGTSAITVLGPANTVVVSIVPDSVLVGGTLSGVATVTDAAAHPLSGLTVTIVSGSTSVATVAPSPATTNASGQVAFTVTGVGVSGSGNTFSSATITASTGGKNGTKTVRVQRPVSTVTLSPSTPPPVGVGGSTTLTITARAANGLALPGRPCTTASNPPGIVTISQASPNTNGAGQITLTVTGVAVGTATITATCEGIIGTKAITVQ